MTDENFSPEIRTVESDQICTNFSKLCFYGEEVFSSDVYCVNRLMWSFAYVALIYYTPNLIQNNGVISVPTHYYFILGFVSLIHEVS